MWSLGDGCSSGESLVVCCVGDHAGQSWTLRAPQLPKGRAATKGLTAVQGTAENLSVERVMSLHVWPRVAVVVRVECGGWRLALSVESAAA